MARLSSSAKGVIGLVVVPSLAAVVFTLVDRTDAAQPAAPPRPAVTTAGLAPAVASPAPSAVPGRRKVTVALSQWPGHLALVVGNGGLTTQPGSAAAAQGLDLTITFIEDAPSKNKALVEGKIDAVWETVDELPISLGAFKAGKLDARAFLQIDWSRGGDACVASKEVQKVEDVVGHKSA